MSGDQPTSGRAADPKLLVDGHVHFHECFAWRAFLDAASRNVARARSVLGLTLDSPGCLMFTESAGANHYRTLVASRHRSGRIGWALERGGDGRSVVLTRPRDCRIVVIAGKQIVTHEHLGGAGARMREAVSRWAADGRRRSQSRRRGWVAVIPWGYGKWQHGTPTRTNGNVGLQKAEQPE